MSTTQIAPTKTAATEASAPKQSWTARVITAALTLIIRCTPWGRYRAIVAPYWLSLAIAFGATLANIHGAPLAPLVGVVLAAIFWWGPALLERWHRRKGENVEIGATRAGYWLDRKQERVYAALVCVLASGMASWVAWSGWAPLAGWSWLALTLAAALPWQNHYQWWLRTPSSGALPAAWPKCQEKIPALRDVHLGRNVGEGSTEKHLLTVPDGKEAASVLGTGGAVAGILNLPPGSVTVALGDDAEDLTARQAWIVKSPKEKLRTSQVYPGATLGPAGIFHIANAPDGPLNVIAHDKDGVKHFAGFGTTGSGKGSVEALHIMNRVETGMWLPILVDGKGGTSIHGALQDACYHVARSPAQWGPAIDGTWRAMVKRREEMGRRRLTRYRIADMWEEFPAVALILDECPALARALSNLQKQHLLEIAEHGRALGYAVGAFGQSSRGDMIPGGTPFRGLLTGGGAVWYGRAGDSPRDKSVTIDGRDYSLANFPAGAGWGYIAGGAVAGQRVVKARTLWVPDDPEDIDHLTGWTPSKPLPIPNPIEAAAMGFDTTDYDAALVVGPGAVIKVDGGPTAEDAILAILADAEKGLSMGEITRRTADLPWREGRPYDRSTIRERLPQMGSAIALGDDGWKLI